MGLMNTALKRQDMNYTQKLAFPSMVQSKSFTTYAGV
jgi:hypothetical protein